MIKRILTTAILIMGPLIPAAAFTPVGGTTPNAFMVENTSGTSPSGQVCYDFITKPTCSTFINGLSSASITAGSTFYIQNTLSPTTTTQVFSVANGVLGTVRISSNAILSGTTFYQNGPIATSLNLLSLGAISANNFNSTGSTPPQNGWTTSAANTISFYTATTLGMAIDSSQNVSIPNTLTVSTISASSATFTSATIGNLGVSSMTTTLPMSARKITGLANGTVATDAVALGQLAQLQASTQCTQTTQLTNGTSGYLTTGLTCTITPTTTASRVKINVTVPWQVNALIANTDTDNQLQMNLLRTSTQIFESGTLGNAFAVAVTQNALGSLSFTFIDSPATASAVTYTVQFRKVTPSASTARVPANSNTAVMILDDVK